MTATVRSIKNRRREAERRALELEAKILEWAEKLDAMPLSRVVRWRMGDDMRAAVASPWPREEKGK
jgi:predicted Ser/Thr protein kinase